MTLPDLEAARAFVAMNARLLDRRRLDLLLDDAPADGVFGALAAHRNPDDGFGWGLEPDLRSVTSQPAAAMHALAVIAEAGPETTPMAVALCDWLHRHTLADGGLPFALPIHDPAGCAPWWVAADTTASSLQMTTQVAAAAHRVAGHDAAVAGHPWLAAATAYCLSSIEALAGGDPPTAYELKFVLDFLDATAHVAGSGELLAVVGPHIPPSGSLRVEGGTEHEMLRPLDFAPRPDAPARALFADDVVAADLDRLAGAQQPDGGWTVDYGSSSPAGAMEWRGDATVRAVDILRRNQRI